MACCQLPLILPITSYAKSTMFQRLITVPAKFATWFRWLGEFLTSRRVRINDRLTVDIASDWSVKLSKDRRAMIVSATGTATYELTAAESAIVRGEQGAEVSDGVLLRITKPLLSWFRLTSVMDGRLKLPEGLSLEVDGAPDPVMQSITVDGESLIVNLSASVLGMPVSGTVTLQPEGTA